ncbi:hypothetical protein T10_1835, partial [Trichinella papuae]
LTTNTVIFLAHQKITVEILFFVSFRYRKPTTRLVTWLSTEHNDGSIIAVLAVKLSAVMVRPSRSKVFIVDKVFFLVFSSLTDAIAADVDNPLELVEDASCEVLKAVCSNVTSTQKMTVFAR